MRENSTKMLATPDALHAAHSALDAEYGSHCAQPSECFVCDTHDSVGLIIEAAAPLIAATALRDAANELDSNDGEISMPVGLIAVALRARADWIEKEADRG